MRPAVRPITNPADWAILASPARLPLIEALRRQPPESAPFSVRTIAALIGLPPDRLYRHIAKLVKVGVLVEVTSHPSERASERASQTASHHPAAAHGRERERWYDLTADDFQIAFPNSGVAGREVLIGTANTFLRMAGGSIKGAARAGLLKLETPHRNITMHCDQGVLTSEQFQRIRALYLEAKAIIDQARDAATVAPRASTLAAGPAAESAGQLYLTLMIATPVAPERRGGGRTRGVGRTRNASAPTPASIAGPHTGTSTRTRRAKSNPSTVPGDQP